MASALTGIQPLYLTGQQQGGNPLTGQGAYGLVPNLPLYTTDTSQQIGTDVQAQMLANLPNYQGMLGQDVANIGANLQGQVAPDVVSQLAQQSAERGIGMGAPGAPNANAAFLRALGLTSMQLQQLGNQQLTQAMARTPIQKTDLTTQTTDLGAARAQMAAAPSPAAAAAAALAAAKQGIQSGAGSVRMPSAPSMPSYSTPAQRTSSYNPGPVIVRGGTGWAPSPWEPSIDPKTGTYTGLPMSDFYGAGGGYAASPQFNTGYLGGSDLLGGMALGGTAQYNPMAYDTSAWSQGDLGMENFIPAGAAENIAATEESMSNWMWD